MGNQRSPFFFASFLLALMISTFFVLFIITGSLVTSLASDGTTGKDSKQEGRPYKDAEIAIKIIPSTNGTFGYDILLSGKPLVHQPNIPGLPGKDGFATKEKARTVAEFVAKKIRNNEMPPTVTLEDLNNMGVLK